MPKYFHFWKKKEKEQESAIKGLLFFSNEDTPKEWNPETSKSNIDWVEESFINYSDEELSKTDKNFLGLSLDAKRLMFFLTLIFFCFFILLARVFYLQIIQGEHYKSIAEDNRIKIYNLAAPRGIIYDKNQIPLVKNVPSFGIFITPVDFFISNENSKQAIDWLKANFPQKTADLDQSIEKIKQLKKTNKSYHEPILILDHLDYDSAIKSSIYSRNFSGLTVETQAKRDYISEFNGQKISSLSHLLGYMGKISDTEFEKLGFDDYLYNDSIGKMGLELEYENLLRGKYGQEKIETDSLGKAIKIIENVPIIKGNNITLNIDVFMQSQLERIMSDYLKKEKKSKAVGIIINPNNGKVLSLISLPSFDNNLFANGISENDYQLLMNNADKPLFNRAVSGEYPSGSTIKPAIGAAALQEGIITEKTSFLSIGGIRIGEWFFPDWLAGGHGITNIRKALAQSVNTFFYIIGGGYGNTKGLGLEKIKTNLEKFGLNKLTGIDLPGERPGFLPTAEWKEKTKGEPWYIGDTYHLAIGQGDLLVNPLQVANYTAFFANGSKLYQPQLINYYFDQTAKKNIYTEPKILNENFIDPKNVEIIRQGMRQAVTSGSARRLSGLPVASAAKTGTAQWGLEKIPHAWFIAFAPYTNPEIAITILVEEGKEGSVISSQIAYDFMKWYFSGSHKFDKEYDN